MKPQTSQRVFKAQMPWIKHCCKVLNKTFAELIEEWERQVKLHKQREFYNLLPMPNIYSKPIKIIKTRKLKRYKICIQKGMAS